MFYNKIILIGNLTKDPELRYTPAGLAVSSFQIAVNESFKKGDEKQEETLFIGVKVFGRQAETTSEYLSKGSGVLVEGRLTENKWEADGQKKSRFEVVASNVRFMPRKTGKSDYSGGGSSGASGGSSGGSDDARVPSESTDLEPF
jgi:single-strand DNA-binding protein